MCHNSYIIVMAHCEFSAKKYLNCEPCGKMKHIASRPSFRQATHVQLWELHQNCINSKIDLTCHYFDLTTMVFAMIRSQSWNLLVGQVKFNISQWTSWKDCLIRTISKKYESETKKCSEIYVLKRKKLLKIGSEH